MRQNRLPISEKFLRMSPVHFYLSFALMVLAVAFAAHPLQADVTEVWAHPYNNLVNNGEDQASKVMIDPAGDIIVTGTTDGGATGRDILTIKYSGADGSALWQQRYNGPANFDDYPSSMGVDRSGNVVVAGTSYNNAPCWCYNDQDYYLAKYAAADGALLWEKRQKGPGKFAEQFTAVALDGSGNVAVTGYFYNPEGSGYYTAKFSGADGALLWEKRVVDRGGYAIAMDADGDVFVTGILLSGNYSSESYTAKYATANGALLWEQRYNGPSNHYTAMAVAVDVSGNMVVAGNSGDEKDRDYFTIKYAAADGAVLWERSYNGPANRFDEATGVAVDSTGNVVVTGSSQGDYYTAKYGAIDGALLWEKRGPGGRANAIGVDHGGNVVVTGSAYKEFGSDYYTAMYAATDGTLLWEKRYNGPANGDDFASSLAVGPNGMLAIAGSSDGNFGTNPAHEHMTIVYRQVLSPVGISLVSSGVLLRFTGIVGQSYSIERAPAVTGPWTTVDAQLAGSVGLIQYEEATKGAAARFYRTQIGVNP
jgi:hypothetical protein